MKLFKRKSSLEIIEASVAKMLQRDLKIPHPELRVVDVQVNRFMPNNLAQFEIHIAAVERR